MKCKDCGGTIIHEEGYGHNKSRDYCYSCGREPKLEVTMAYNLNPQKEEEVKALLKTHSQREIVKITGVAKNTITRIRNENLTEEEKIELEKQALVRSRHKRELKKADRIIPEIIPSEEKEEIMDKIVKTCTKCKNDFPPTNEHFSKNKARPDGLESWCKLCKKKAQADYRKNKENNKNLPVPRKSSIRRIPPQGGLITRATPDEIIKALRKGVAEEIFGDLAEAIVKIRERF